jgi:hypothetical protein
MLSSAIPSLNRLHKYQFNMLILYGFTPAFWQTARRDTPIARDGTGSGSQNAAPGPMCGMVLKERFLCS